MRCSGETAHWQFAPPASPAAPWRHSCSFCSNGAVRVRCSIPAYSQQRQWPGVGALLTAIQFGYWAVLVYLPLFLSAGLLVSMEVAGVALLAATLPMLLVPLIGGRFVTQWGWRRFFVVAFGIIAAGDALLALAAISSSPAMRLATTITGMLTIGVGAALANPQMSRVVLALAPSTYLGMASAVTLIVRQAGFAISIAALGATLTTTDMATAFAAP